MSKKQEPIAESIEETEAAPIEETAAPAEAIDVSWEDRPQPEIITEMRAVKHVLTRDERDSTGSSLARALTDKRGIETEFDQVKASYKAKLTAADTQIQLLSTTLCAGFEMRQKLVYPEYDPKAGKKRWFLADSATDSDPVLVEDMTPGDYQMDLIRGESPFGNKEEIVLCPYVDSDGVSLIVGSFNGYWYSSLRGKIGSHTLTERLDTEQQCYTERFQAVETAAVRLKRHLTKWFGKDTAVGFNTHIDAAVQSQKLDTPAE